ncbi:protein-export chaperone SecB [Paracoccus sp. p4-l81]|uniref:protein-export chaperone SecB n=1 Tax=unclassified Paracoccus (in: a-proteobacteria) TaxID=2688777 RepID=UPI0035B87E1E
MSDETTAADQDGAAAAAPQVRFQILAQFIRDLSFENIVAQKGLQGGEVTPEFQVQISLDARKRGTDNQYEIVSKYRVSGTNTATQQPMFLVELDYGGIFHIEGIPEDQMHPFLLIECPRMMFPYVRRIVADVTADGGFPPFNMEPVDFVQLYRQQLARNAELAAAAKPEGQPLS